MPKGISLHIGLNFVDPAHYDGWNGQLAACEFDAEDMAALAKSRGFKTGKLIREKATAKAVKTAIESAAKALAAGDTFFLTYSGHGGQVPDLNGDEGKFGDANDRKDETWCLFDRELIDDELAALWTKFNKGVRIVVLSDSCHSASVVRAWPLKPRGRVRAMPRDQAVSVYEKNQGIYDAIQFSLKGSEQAQIKAAVLLISGCLDNQTSSDGDRNGLFTETLKAVWSNGAFTGGYREFRDTIAARMPEDQTPTYFIIGGKNPAFEKEQPFTIKPKAKKATAAAAKPVTRGKAKAKPIEVVLAVLSDVGLRGPDGELANASTDISDWFRRAAAEDEAMAVPGGGRVGRFIVVVGERLGIDLSFDDLVAGDYPTPQDIADLV